MKFKVTGISDIVCCGCSGITRVAQKRVYNTDDLTCNCAAPKLSMEFGVTGITDIIGVDCGVFNRVVPEKVYKLDELQCNEEPEGSRPPADDGTDDEAAVKEDDEAAVKEDDEATEKKKSKQVQTEMFVEPPENVINPADDDMSEDEVRKYLKSLGWQELLEAAKNNEVMKPPKVNRKELEELIVQKVFHE